VWARLATVKKENKNRIMTTKWNFMMLERVPGDPMVRPTVGPEWVEFEDAHKEIQNILDRLQEVRPDSAHIADLWRGGAKDNIAFFGPFVWVVYAQEGVETPQAGATEWLKGFK
jgi:hypothetical protein